MTNTIPYTSKRPLPLRDQKEGSDIYDRASGRDPQGLPYVVVGLSSRGQACICEGYVAGDLNVRVGWERRTILVELAAAGEDDEW